MAIVFELWAECEDALGRKELISHFSKLEHTLQSGKKISWQASEEKHFASSPGVSVWSNDLSQSGVRTVLDAVECSEAGLWLYSHLKNAPPFRFARADWEASTSQMCELKDFITHSPDGLCRLDVECVVDDRLYLELGQPQFCKPFRDGYWWTTYRGETYHPLMSNDQGKLNALCAKLFPDYFKTKD